MSATITNANLPVIALVGRVNVGKSTLFNSLIEEQKALVSNTPGTTRTSNEGEVLWRGKRVRIIDTGGLTFEDDVPLEEDIIVQSEKAIKEADVVVFVTDSKTGILPQEKELAKRLRKSNKPTLVLANKADSNKIESEADIGEWLSLGLGDPFFLSAVSGRNVGDFLDIVFKQLQKASRRPKKIKDTGKSIRISLIGKPNVGKSSLFNKIIGEDRVIVSDMAHTTREPFDTDITYAHQEGKRTKKQSITFVDTAGIRRKAKVRGGLERSGIHKSVKAVEESDLILFVLDASKPISSQDKQLGGLIEKRGKSVIILLNKWDLSEDKSDTWRNEVKRRVFAHFPHLDYAEIVFVSGKTGYSVHKIFPIIMKIWQARHIEIPGKALEKCLEEIMKKHKPSRGKGTRHPKILGIKQIGVAPPVIQLLIKYRTSLHSSYVNFIEHQLRNWFDFTGTPIIIRLKKQRR